jgi:hypothetical protein
MNRQEEKMTLNLPQQESNTQSEVYKALTEGGLEFNYEEDKTSNEAIIGLITHTVTENGETNSENIFTAKALDMERAKEQVSNFLLNGQSEPQPISARHRKTPNPVASREENWQNR